MAISHYFKSLREKVGSELLLIPAVAAVIRDESGAILFQRPWGERRWSLPAGSIEPGESPAEAVVREVWEETGLQVKPTKVLAMLGGKEFRTTYANGDRVEYHVGIFACEVLGGELGGLDDETEELRFFPVDALPEFVLPYPIDILTYQ